MSNVFLSVERATVNYEQTINFLIDASFNSLTQAPGSNIELVCFLPDTINYTHHSPSYPIQTITEVPVSGGTNLIFTLIPLPESGISLYVDLYATFKLSTPNNTQVIMQVTVNQTGQASQVYDSPPVTLSATANYIATQATILPNPTGCAPGSIFVYDIIIENIGDLGALATNFTLTEILPAALTLDTSYPITGLDISNNHFADTSADGIAATIINANSFSFLMPAYKGTKYRIRFKGKIASDARLGTEYIATATYSYTTAGSYVGPLTCNDVFEVEPANPSGATKLYFPNYSTAGALINGTCSISNTGNVPLQNASFQINSVSSGVVPYVNFTSLKTGTMSIPILDQLLSIPYTISFTTLKGNPIPSISANTDTPQSLKVAGLPPGDQIITIVYDFKRDIPVGASFDSPISYNGVVYADSPNGSHAYMDTTFDWSTPSDGVQQLHVNATCTLDNICELHMTAVEVSPNASVKPGDTITYQATIDCLYSTLIDPVFVMILDRNLSYAHAITYTYTDFFGIPTTTIPRPIPVIIPNYNGGGNTLLMISYSGADTYSFNQLATITITLSFTVNTGAKGSINQQMLLGTLSGEFSVASDCDTFNAVQPNGSIRALLATKIFTNQIEVSMSISSDFLVKGSLDTNYMQYPNIGSTLAGDTLHYQLTLTNNGDTNLDSVEIVNILPHVGDTGVILTTTPRNSQFNIYPVSFSQASLTPLVPTDPIPTFTVYYSQSYNPVRFGPNANTIIGTVDDWTTVHPQDATTIKSYKLVCTNAIFRPSQTLTLITLAIAPTRTSANLQAWNSFAAKITYTNEDGSTATLLPVEPEMTGVKIIPPIPGTVTLGGFVWEDLAKTGIYQAGDPGINDTAVLLYDHTGAFLQTAFTAPNTSGQAGYYTFSNMPHGQYYIKFVPNTLRYDLTKQVLDNPNGSMPFPNTGVTPLIDMTTLTENLSISAGLIDISQMNNILAINKSANKMLRSVIYSQMLLDMKLEDTIKLID